MPLASEEGIVVETGAPEWLGDRRPRATGLGDGDLAGDMQRRDSTESRLDSVGSIHLCSFSDCFPRTAARKSRSEGDEAI